jgi:hypothetical protein
MGDGDWDPVKKLLQKSDMFELNKLSFNNERLLER